MPPLEWGGHLIELLFDVGPCIYTGFGPSPISEQDLAAWQFNRGVKLTPWECEILRRLSREYVSMSHEAESSRCSAPYRASMTPEVAVKMGDVLMAQLKAMASKGTKKRPK